MRTVVLKMPLDGRGQDQWAGQQGEHRLTQLVIPLPRETAKKIKSCVALFVLDDERRMISPLITEGDSGDCYFKDSKVYIVLWRELTQARSLRVQLECYSDNTGQIFIDRTPISERVMFGKSLKTCLHDFPEISDRPSVLAQMIVWMHNHPNTSLLDALTENENGTLCFKGEAFAKDADLQAEASVRGGEDDELWEAMPQALTNLEIDSVINQALTAIYN